MAVNSELEARHNWARCAERVVQGDKESSKLKSEIKNLSLVAVTARDSCKDAEREVKQYIEKAQILEAEVSERAERRGVGGGCDRQTLTRCAAGAAEGGAGTGREGAHRGCVQTSQCRGEEQRGDEAGRKLEV